jgi:signal transduction histidine kinase
MQVMGPQAVDPRWPKLLSLAVHEFRTPITVVAGYIRMLLKERAGAVTDQQRKLLEEAEKSCGRLSALVTEMSDLSALEAGTAALNRGQVALAAIVTEVIGALPELADRPITVELRQVGSPATVNGDATRLRLAMTSLIMALRRELITSDRLIVRISAGNGAGSVVAIGDPERVDGVAEADPASLTPFNEWRGGSGLSLAIARRIIGQHGGALYNPPGDDKAGALVVLPAA